MASALAWRAASGDSWYAPAAAGRPVRGPGHRLSELACAAGYADQPHLSRDCRAIAGVSPAELAGRGRELLTGDPDSLVA